MEEKELKTYEIGFLTKEEDGVQEIANIINGHKATIINDGQIKKIQLSYPIEKQTAAYFGYLLFSLEPQSLAKLSDALKINSKILRFLIIIPTTVKPLAPSAGPVKKDYPIKPVKPVQQLQQKTSQPQTLSNEALERKLEEILK